MPLKTTLLFFYKSVISAITLSIWSENNNFLVRGYMSLTYKYNIALILLYLLTYVDELFLERRPDTKLLSPQCTNASQSPSAPSLHLKGLRVCLNATCSVVT